jgi:hypothetical protein
MPPPVPRLRGQRTVAGTPNSRDPGGAHAPLLSHTTARSRQAGTSFESHATRAGRRIESQPTGTSQRYEPGSLPSRPGSQRLLTIGRVGARLRAGGPVAYCEARAGARLRAHGASPCCACGPWRPWAARQDCLPRPPRILQAIHRPINGLQDQQLGGWAHAPYQRVFISGDQRAGRSRGTMRIRCRRSRLPRVVTARPIR